MEYDTSSHLFDIPKHLKSESNNASGDGENVCPTENATSVEDIDYGLIMRIRGGLLDSKSTALDVNLELSYPQVSAQAGTQLHIHCTQLGRRRPHHHGHRLERAGHHHRLSV